MIACNHNHVLCLPAGIAARNRQPLRVPDLQSNQSGVVKSVPVHDLLQACSSNKRLRRHHLVTVGRQLIGLIENFLTYCIVQHTLRTMISGAL